MVASLLGVAGDEFLVPTLIPLFGVELKLAGTEIELRLLAASSLEHMMSEQNAVAMASLFKLAQELADEVDRDAPMLQILAFLRVAMAGDAGIDHGQMQNDLKVSSAAMSRTVQALGEVHYSKEKAGYGLVERAFDPSDNRKRIVKLSAKGQKAAARLAQQVGRL